ncbi:MAG: hypothetical protein QM655_16655 [Nocardioidaceae bacterium]
MTVLVVGGTGALRPAARRLAGAGCDVVALARHASVDEGVRSLIADWTDVDTLRAALAAQAPFEAALVYAPRAANDALQAIRDVTVGRVVLSLSSANAAPAGGATRGDDEYHLEPMPGYVLVQLGWTAPPPSRWHTQEEISRACLGALDDGLDRVLGVVRPWSDRP